TMQRIDRSCGLSCRYNGNEKRNERLRLRLALLALKLLPGLVADVAHAPALLLLGRVVIARHAPPDFLGYSDGVRGWIVVAAADRHQAEGRDDHRDGQVSKPKTGTRHGVWTPGRKKGEDWQGKDTPRKCVTTGTCSVGSKLGHPVR